MALILSSMVSWMQGVTPGYAVRNFLSAMFVKLFNRHGLVAQPTAKCDFLGNTARQLH
jgi:hypothetical protein